MRKNFTQLFLGFALILGFTVASNAQCEIDPPEGALYNFQFDGSLEGWRSLDAAGIETTSGWRWDETGTLKQGFYSTNYPDVIASESQCNGAAVMDSDFLDNQGLGPDFFQTGECPATSASPCNGYLVSPVMDLSSASSVELWFSQSVRQFQSSYFIYVSTDGGVTNVDTVEINDDLVTNAAVSSRDFRLPLCAAGGSDNVVITFHYEANYYVWAIDDISIVPASADEVDMRVNSNFYAKVGNYRTPANMVTKAQPLVDIENLKAFPYDGASVIFNARNEAGDIFYTDELTYPEVPGCSTDENRPFPNQFDLPTEMGRYSLEYLMNAPGDLNPDNDTVTAPFIISEREFRKLPTQEEFGSEYLTGVRYGGTYISWGGYFHMPNNDGNQAIESVSLGIISNADDPPEPGIINVAVYQWIDFDDIGTVNEGERVLLGETEILVAPGSPEFNQWTVTPTNEDGEMIVPEANAELLVIGHSAPFSGTTNYFFNAVPSTGFEQFSQGATNLAHREVDLIGGYASFASGDSPSNDDRHDRELFNVDGAYTFDVSMLLTPPTGTEDINENLGVKIYPSPASTLVNVDVSLEKLSDKVSIEIMDLAGNKIGQYNYSNIKKDRLTIDVSDLVNGMYLMNVRTEEGMTSKKITVIH